jgi:hypothetical protein
MMNGLPLLGLNDYVVLSDFVGQQIGQSTKATLLSSPGYKEKFHNFLEVRSNRIFLYPDSCWTRQLVEYMRNETVTFRSLTVKVFRTKKQALHHCCHNVWAIIEVQAGDEEVLDSDCQLFEPEVQSNTTLLQQALSGVVPEITIRMHPAAVPDTRNFEYSPINRHLLTRQESGQLLYFTSGFLTLQIEIQNFLAHYQLGGPEIHSKVFSGENGDILLRPALAAHSLAVSLAAARTEEDVYLAVRNASRSNAGVRPSLAFPLFHRAFPTHNNKQVRLSVHPVGSCVAHLGFMVYLSLSMMHSSVAVLAHLRCADQHRADPVLFPASRHHRRGVLPRARDRPAGRAVHPAGSAARALAGRVVHGGCAVGGALRAAGLGVLRGGAEAHQPSPACGDAAASGPDLV